MNIVDKEYRIPDAWIHLGNFIYTDCDNIDSQSKTPGPQLGALWTDPKLIKLTGCSTFKSLSDFDDPAVLHIVCPVQKIEFP